MAGTWLGHDDGKGVASVKRILVFLVLGPTVVAIIGSAFLPHGLIAITLFLFTVAVSVFAASVDGYLAWFWPIYVRAPVTAIVGATVAAGLAGALLGWFMPQAVTPAALGGAFCMGWCSLLSHDYARSRAIHPTSASAGP
jgi:hypothetical protein